MMKILYFTSSFPDKENSSSGIFIYDRVKKLLENKINTVVLKYYTNPISFHKLNFIFKKNFPSYNTSDFDLLPAVKVNQFKINKIYIPFTNIHHFFLKRLSDYFINNKFDLIHSHFVWDSYIPYLLKMKYNIPYVVTAHGSDIHTIPFKNRFYKNQTLRILDNAEKVIFVSEYLLKKAKEFGYSANNSIVINNGVDLKRFSAKKKNTVKLKDPELKTVGFIGSLIKIKRAEILPEIFSGINKKNDKVKFVIIGGGEFFQKIKSRLKELGLDKKTEMTDRIHTNEIGVQLNNFDCLILPSRNEGLPCVVLEALACGVQIVGSAKGGIPEAIGDCGIIVKESEDFNEEFSSAVLKLLSKPIPGKRLIIRAEKFDFNNTIKKEIEVYKDFFKRQGKN